MAGGMALWGDKMHKEKFVPLSPKLVEQWKTCTAAMSKVAEEFTNGNPVGFNVDYMYNFTLGKQEVDRLLKEVKAPTVAHSFVVKNWITGHVEHCLVWDE
jgi:hypothetical protein